MNQNDLVQLKHYLITLIREDLVLKLGTQETQSQNKLHTFTC